MSNLRKCAQKDCKKEINIKRDNHYTWNYDCELTNRRSYYCEECGKQSVKELRKAGGELTVMHCFKHFFHIGKELERIHSISVDGLEHINLGYIGGEVERMALTLFDGLEHEGLEQPAGKAAEA